MNKTDTQSTSRGYTLTELLVGMNVILLSSAAVFALISHVMLFSSQEENYQQIRNDLLLTMGQIRKDIQLSTNVVPSVGFRTTGNTTLALRQPALDMSGDILEGVFEFVTYSVGPRTSSQHGLFREVWASETASAPLHSRILNKNIVALGFLYGGDNVSNTSDLTPIMDIQIFLVSGRETGLNLASGTNSSQSTDADLMLINESISYGLDFFEVRNYIDYMNSEKKDLAIATSMGTAAMRNKKALGLKTPGVPVI